MFNAFFLQMRSAYVAPVAPKATTALNSKAELEALAASFDEDASRAMDDLDQGKLAYYGVCAGCHAFDVLHVCLADVVCGLFTH